MIGAPIVQVLGPFGGNQLITALKAAHSEFGTSIAQYRRHGSLPRSPSPREEVTELYRTDYATTRLDLDQERIVLSPL